MSQQRRGFYSEFQYIKLMGPNLIFINRLLKHGFFFPANMAKDFMKIIGIQCSFKEAETT